VDTFYKNLQLYWLLAKIEKKTKSFNHHCYPGLMHKKCVQLKNSSAPSSLTHSGPEQKHEPYLFNQNVKIYFKVTFSCLKCTQTKYMHETCVESNQAKLLPRYCIQQYCKSVRAVKWTGTAYLSLWGRNDCVHFLSQTFLVSVHKKDHQIHESLVFIIHNKMTLTTYLFLNILLADWTFS